MIERSQCIRILAVATVLAGLANGGIFGSPALAAGIGSAPPALEPSGFAAIRAERHAQPRASRPTSPRAPGGPVLPLALPACDTTWSSIGSSQGTNTDSFLSGAAAVGAHDIWAVGDSSNVDLNGNTTSDETLAEHWDGSGWTTFTTPNGGSTFAFFSGAAAVSSSNVWAVGAVGLSDVNGAYDGPLAAQWNGTSWNGVSAQLPAAGQGFLVSAAAVSSSDGWAVGTASGRAAGAVSQTLIERWNGASWQVFPSPNFGFGDNFLFGVTAVSATDVWAVGYWRFSNNNNRQTLVLHFDGTSWKNVPSDDVVNSTDTLYDIGADASGDAWAVGRTRTATSDHALVERYNGTRFNLVSSSNPGMTYNRLFSVAVLNANNAWAVGNQSNSAFNAQATGAVFQTLIEHWDGTSWSVVTSPNNNSNTNEFSAIAAVSPADLWAVGDYDTGTAFQTSTARWCAPPPTVTGIIPTGGSVLGGTTVTITGSGFTYAAKVNFGTTPASSFTVNSDSQITAVSPSHPVGQVDVTVMTTGPSATSSADLFTYFPNYVFSPLPIAPDHTLAANQAVAVTLTAKNNDGSGVSGAQVYLSFSQAPGGGTAAVGATQLTGTPAAFMADANGTIAITYTAPASLPATAESDIITAASAAASPVESSQDSYTFGRRFYFAEGFTGCGYQENLSLLMPNAGGTANIDYYTTSGHVGPVHAVLSAGRVSVENVNTDVGPNQSVSARVTLPAEGVVERILHFNCAGIRYGSTDKVGATAPATEWDFAEGSTFSAYTEFLTLQNPNPMAVNITLKYFTDTGQHPVKHLTLPPNSRTTINVYVGNLNDSASCTATANGDCGVGSGVGGLSIQVVSDAPIIAERPFYVANFNFGFGAIKDGHDAFGANSAALTWNFAEGTTFNGFNEYLTLQNPSNNAALVDLKYFTDTGAHPVKTLTVPANTRVTVLVFQGDTTTSGPCTAGAAGNCGVGRGVGGVSVQVSSQSVPIVAERPIYMVVNYGTGSVNGAHVAVGANSFGQLFGFSQASTLAGENEFLTIQNPSLTTAANLRITYYPPSGPPVVQNVQVPASTRHTVLIYQSLEGAGPGLYPLGIVISSDQPVLVEKPTYSSSGSTYGATDTPGYSPAGF